MAVQTVDRINFGTGRFYETLPGGYPFPIANATDINVDFKADLKEAFGEGGYPLSVADGHRSIDITAKHYNLTPQALANATNGTISTGTSPFAIDEPHTVPTTPFTFTLTNGATLVPNTLVVVAYPLVSGVNVPTVYNIVASGSEAVGVSCSVSPVGVVKFAAADTGINTQCTYQYTNAAGTRVSVANPFQNSAKAYQLVAIKRDNAPLDNSTAQLVYTFFAVRTAGIKNQYQEGAFTVYERSYKAYANPAGLVFQCDTVNV
ncbi:MAG: hypothetical protein JWN27_2893 [Candidatus Eremiobacteraeota bacterium]|nr:hypothetical protein [Candidatus Eremiobacteraeota bacterium]